MSERPFDSRRCRAALVLCLSAAVVLLLVGCGAQDEEAFDDSDTFVVEDTAAADTEPVADVGPSLVLAPRQADWMAPADPEACTVCQPCFGDGDCGAGESCVNFDGGQRCTALCSSGTCPGDSRCFDATDVATGRTTAICLNPDAETSFCDPSFICGPDGGPDPDASDTDTDTSPSGYATRCNTGSVCNYCGDALGVVETCPPDAPQPVCEVLRLVNQERANEGLLPVAWHAALARSAQLHAIDMTVCDYHEHDSLDGRNFADRELAAGYDASPGGENIAAGQETAAEVMESWMNSPGHRANILTPGFNELGVGFYQGDPNDPDPWMGRRWVQNFGIR